MVSDWVIGTMPRLALLFDVSMSNKFALSDLIEGIDRQAEASVTGQLVAAFAAAIEDGRLAPGDKLPPTRALAEAAGINHLTAARVYKRLAEEGYVTAQVGRGTFVRLRASAVVAEPDSDEWQQYLLPELPASAAEKAHPAAFPSPFEPDVLSLGIGWASPDTLPTDDLRRISNEAFDDVGGEGVAHLTVAGRPTLRGA